MTPPKVSYYQSTALPSAVVREDTIEYGFIGTLQLFIVSNRDSTFCFANNANKLPAKVRLIVGETELNLVA